MKLTELHPCHRCGGNIVPTFYVVRIAPHLIRPSAVNATLGISQILGGSAQALGIAEVLSPDPEAAVAVPGAEVTVVLCLSCYATLLAEVVEGVRERETTPAQRG